MTSFIFSVETAIWDSQGEEYLYPVTNKYGSFIGLKTSHTTNNGVTTVTISWDDYLASYTDTIAFDDVSYNTAEINVSTPLKNIHRLFYREHVLGMKFSPNELKSVGYNAIELKNANYELADLKNEYSIQDLKQAEYSASEMKNVGYTLNELHGIGYQGNELRIAGYSAEQLKSLGFSQEELRTSGYTIKELKEIGGTASEMMSIGFTLSDLKSGQYTLNELQDVSYSIIDLKDAGYLASELKDVYSLEELKEVGYSVENLNAAGFSAQQLLDLGVSLNDMLSYPVTELLSIGKTIADLKSAGFNAEKFKEANESILNLKTVGFTFSELRVAYPEKDIIKAGFTVSELITEKYYTFDTKYTKLMLIDEKVIDNQIFVNSCNDNTLPIIYDENITRYEMTVLLQKNLSIKRICFVFDYTREYELFNGEPLFVDGEKNENTKFMITTLNRFKITALDFLACNTLKDEKWKRYYDVLFENTGVVIGASDDTTGNIKYGGDWILESTNTDVENIYFTESISYYKYLLDIMSNFNHIYFNNKLFLIGGKNSGLDTIINNNELYKLLTPSSKTIRSIADSRVSKFTIALMTDNTIYGIGENDYGQLGIGNSTDTYQFTQVTNNSGKTPLQIICGLYHTILLNTDGSIYVAGYNGYGQLGDGTTTNRSSLVELSNTTGKIPKQVKCGNNFTMILMTDGSIYGCGENNYGQLGDGTTTNSSSLVQLVNNTEKTPEKISTGDNHTSILMSDGTIYSCGHNSSGAFGDGTTTNSSSLVEMTNNTGYTPSEIVCGLNNMTILMTNGKIYGCGYNTYGVLGNGGTTNSSTLVEMTNTTGKTPSSIRHGKYHLVVKMTDGTIYGCGGNQVNSLKNSATTEYTSLTQLDSITGKTIKQIQLGDRFTIVLMTDGSIYLRGYSYTKIAHVSAPSGKTLASYDVGNLHIVCVMTDGTVYGYGWNSSGQLGNGETSGGELSLVEMTLPSGKTASKVCCGYKFTLILMTDGSIYGCGGNSDGQLGINSTSSPQTTLVEMINNTGKTPDTIDAGLNNTMVLMTDGSVYSCGYNVWGQLGDNQVSGNRSYTLVETINNTGNTITHISSGLYHSLVATDYGSAYGVGLNSSDNIFDRGATKAIILTQVPSVTGKTVSKVYAGSVATYVLMTDGSVYSRGSNEQSQLANGQSSSHAGDMTNITDGIGKTAVDVFVGYQFVSILMSDGTIYGGGINTNGQLGDGTTTRRHSLVENVMRNHIEDSEVAILEDLVADGNLASDLKTLGYNVTFLKANGFTAEQLNYGGYTGSQLKEGGFSASDLKAIYYTLSELKALGFTVFDLKTDYSASDATNLINVGFSLSELKSGGFGVDPLKTIGYTLSELKEVGYSVALLKAEYTVSELKDAGFTIRELKEGGITFSQVLPLGFTLTDLSVYESYISDIQAGYGFSIVLMTDGKIYTQGENTYGQLGDRTTTTQSTLVELVNNTGKTPSKISAGQYHTGIMMTDGTIYCVGMNTAGQLGDGSTTDRTGLVELVNNTGKTPETFGCGAYHTSILMTDGTIYSCGSNGNGRLGIGEGSYDGGYTSLQQMINNTGKTIKEFHVRWSRTQLLMTDGSVYAVGYNSFMDGNNHRIDVLKEFTGNNTGKTIDKIALGGNWFLMLMTDGTIYGVGSNAYGQLGTGTVGTEDTVGATNSKTHYTAIQLVNNTGKTPTGVFCSIQSSHVLMSDGSVYSCGWGASGGLGDGLNTVKQANLVQMTNTTGHKIDRIACGQEFSLVLMSNKTVYGVGRNDKKQIASSGSYIYTIQQIENSLQDNVYITDFTTISDMVDNGYSTSDLKTIGYTASELKTENYNISELKDVGFSATELKDASFNVTEMKTVGFTTTELKSAFTPTEIKDDYSLIEIKQADYAVTAIKDASYAVLDLKTVGYTTTDLKPAYSPTELKSTYSLLEIKEADYSASEIKDAAYDLSELKTAGYTTTELKPAYNATELKTEYSLTELKDAAFTSTEMKTAGYTATELKPEYALSELKTIGFTPAELKTAEYTLTELKAVNFTATDLKTAEYTLTELKAEYTLSDLKTAGFTSTEVKNADFTLTELKTSGYTLSELKDASYSTVELKNEGYSASEMKTVGFGVTELITADIELTELKTVGFTATELKTDFSLNELKTVGFTAYDLKTADISFNEILSLGFTLDELLDSTVQVKQISCGRLHTMMLMKNGKIYGTGYNYEGQLGIGNTTDSKLFVELTNNTGKTPITIDCGTDFTMILMSDGSIYATGVNTFGQLGIGSSSNKSSIIEITNNTGKTPESIACGGNHFAILMSDGSIYTTGLNEQGQLGIGNTTDKSSITELTNNTGKTPQQIKCGLFSTTILMTDGSVYSCGMNRYGQLGIGNTTNQTSITQMTNNTGKTVSQITCGSEHTILVMTDGSIYGCGYNGGKELGDGTTTNRTQIVKMTNNTGLTPQKVISDLYNSVTIIMTTGDVYETGNETTMTKLSNPTSYIPKDIALGYNFKFLLMKNGEVYSIGNNSNGQLGVESTVTQTVITSVTSEHIETESLKSLATITEFVSADINVSELKEIGYTSTELKASNYTSTELKTGGFSASELKDASFNLTELKTSGYTLEELKEAAYTPSELKTEGFSTKELNLVGFTEAEVIAVSSSVEELKQAYESAISQIVCGKYHNIILMTNGKLYVVGYNYYGQLGIGNTTKQTSFVELTNTTKKLPTKVVCGDQHTIILMNDGTVYGVGYNYYGQLGNGNTTNQTTLSKMTIPSGKTPSDIRCGAYYTLVLNTDGTIYGCGYNNYGQLGNDTTTNSNNLTAMLIPSGKTAQSITCGENHSTVLMTDGTIYGTGDNFYGQLGDGTSRSKSKLIQMPNTTGKTVSKISNGGNHTMILNTDGTIYGTGYNGNGQLGNGSIVSSLKLIYEMKNTTGKTPESIIGGYDNTFVLMTDGTAYGCGSNSNSQLGNGNIENQLKLIELKSSIGQIAVGSSHVVLITTNDEIYVSGRNNYGQLGTGSQTSKTVFELVSVEIVKSLQDEIGLAQLTDTDFTIGELKTVDYTLEIFKTENYLPSQLKTDFSLNELKTVGFTTTELKTDFSLNELITVGFTVNELKTASYNVTELQDVGFSNSEIKTGGYTASEFVDASLSLIDLKDLGFTLDEVKSADFTIEEVINANYELNDVLDLYIPTILDIQSGGYHMVMLMSNGKIFGIGYNTFGELGIGHFTNTFSLVEMTNNTGKTPSKINCGYNHTVVLMTDGSVYCCGRNNYNQLGDGTTTNSSALIELVNNTGKTVVDIECGYYNTFCLMSDGTIYGLGYNSYGPLGVGNGSTQSSLTLLTNNTGKTPVKISANNQHTMILMSDGSIYGAGNPGNGRLGNGSAGGTYHTIQLMTNNTGKTPTDVITGYSWTIVIMSDGSIYGCGQNFYGELGIGNTPDKSTIVQMTNNTGKTPTQVACGERHTIVLMSDGTIYGTGMNTNGQLGDGSTTNKNTLTQLTNNTGKTPNKIACGRFYTIFATADVNIYETGRGSLGNNTTISAMTIPSEVIVDKPPANVLKSNGYSIEDMKAIDYTVEDLKTDFSLNELYDASFTISELRTGGFATNDFKDASLNISILKTGGFTATELLDGSFNASELKTGGYTVSELKDASLNIVELQDIGFSTNEIKTGGFTASDFIDASFSLTDLKTGGFSSSELKSEFTLQDMLDASFTVSELKTGFTASELVSDFSLNELKTGGFSPSELKSEFTLQDMLDVSFTVTELKAGGFTASELVSDFSLNELKTGGFSPSELKSEFTLQDLVDISYTATELKTDFSLNELKTAGMSITQVKDDFTIEEIKEEYSFSDVLTVGYDIDVIKENYENTIDKIEIGYEVSFILMKDNKIYGCGKNSYGQLGIGNTTNQSTLIEVTNNTGKIPSKISTRGGYHTIIMMTDRTIYGCGYNSFGQLGIGNTTNQTSFTSITNNTGKTPVDIETGWYHTLVLMNDGTIYGCGWNNVGQLGDGTNTNRNTLTQMTNSTGKTVDAMFCGSTYSMLLMTDGTIYGCGRGIWGQLGTGNSNTINSSLVELVNNTGQVPKTISCGDSTIIEMTNGDVYGCGNNSYGQLGIGNTTNQLSIVKIIDNGTYSVKQVLNSSTNTFFLMTDGTIYGAGSNTYGQLGDGTTTNNSSLVEYSNTTGKTPTELLHGNHSIFVLMSDGTIYGAGSNNYGQMGIGNTTNQTSFAEMNLTPLNITRLLSLTTINGLKTNGYSATELRTGGFTVTELKTDFSLNELKTGGFSPSELKEAEFTSTELKDVSFNATELKTAGFTASELKTDFSLNELKTGGFSVSELKAAEFTSTELKDVSFNATELKTAGFTASELKTDFSLNELKTGGFSVAELKAAEFTPTELKDVSFNATELKTGGFTASELKTDFSLNELKTVGFSVSELKDASFSSLEMKDVSFDTVELKLGGFSASELKDAGYSLTEITFAAVDPNELKEIGYTASELKSVGITAEELNVAGFTTTDIISAGFSAEEIKETYDSFIHQTITKNDRTIILMTDGTIYGCGYNAYGQLGNGNTTNQTTMVEMTNNTGKIPLRISCGDRHTIILMTDGTVYGCGYNTNGELGDGTTTDRTTMVKMINTTGRTPEKVECGANHNVLLMKDSSIYACGRNAYGQLGDGTTTNRTTLVEVLNSTDKIPVQIYVKGDISMLLMRDGSIYGCGSNSFGQLGDGTTTDRSTIVEMTNSSSSTPKDIQVNGSNTIILMNDDTIYATGYNNYGQLGNGTSGITYVNPPTNSFILTGDSKSLTDVNNPNIALELFGNPTFGTDGVELTDTTSKYIKVPQSILMFGSNDFTVSVSIKDAVYTGNTAAWILGFGVNYHVVHDHIGRYFFLGYKSSYIGGVYFHDKLGVQDGVSATTLVLDYIYGSDSDEHTFTISRKDGNMYVFIDNELMITPYAQPGPLRQDDQNFIGGGYQSNSISRPITGKITKFEVWDGVGFDTWPPPETIDINISSQSTLVEMVNTTGTTPKRIINNNDSVMILTMNGEIYGTGYNNTGIIGDGTTTNRSYLTQMINNTGKTPSEISSGSGYTMVLMDDGTIYGTGLNDYGQLGIGNTTNQTLLVELINNTGKIPKEVKCDDTYTKIVMTDGSIYGCGQNDYGQLGDGSTTNRSIIVEKTVDLEQDVSEALSVSLLISSGYDVTDLKEMDYTPTELKDSGVSLTDMVTSGFSVNELKDASYNATELKDLSFNVSQLKDASFAVVELKEATFTATEIKTGGFSITEIKDASFTAVELKSEGFEASVLKEAFNASELKDASYTVIELKDASFNATELKEASFTATELKDASFNATELKDASFTVIELKDASFTASEIKTGGFSITEIKDASFTAVELKSEGFTASDMKDAYSAVELKDASFTALEIKTGGFSITEIKDASFTVVELKSEGFTASDMKDAYSVVELKDASFTALEIKTGGFSITEIKDASFTVVELKSEGFTASEMKDAYSAVELKDASYSVVEIKEGGYSSSEIKDASFTAIELKADGFTASDLKAGFTATELKDASFTALEMKAGGYSSSELKDASFTALELKTEGFTASDLKAGFSATELKDASFTALEIKAAAYTVAEIKAAAFTAADLRTQGFTVFELKTGGYNATELKTGGYTATELKAANFSKTELKTANFTAREMKTAAYTSTELKAEGYTVREMREGLYSASSMVTAGFTGLEMKQGGYSAKELRNASISTASLRTLGYDAKEMKSSLFSASQLKSVGYTLTELKEGRYTKQELLDAGYSEQEAEIEFKISGSAIDGYIRDASGQLVDLSNGTVIATFNTDSAGEWSLDISENLLPDIYKIELLAGGVDIITNETVNTTLSTIATKDNSSVSNTLLYISSLSTITAGIIETKYTEDSSVDIDTILSESNTIVSTVLDVSENDLDTDYITEGNITIMKAALKVFAISDILSGVLQSVDGTKTNDQTFGSIINVIYDMSGTIDFTDPATISSIISGVITNVDSGIVSNAVIISTEISNYIDNESSGDFETSIKDIEKASITLTNYVENTDLANTTVTSSDLQTEIANSTVTVSSDVFQDQTTVCLSQSSDNAVTVINGNFVFNDVIYDANELVGVSDGEYTFTGISSSYPISFIIDDASLVNVKSSTTTHGSVTIEGVTTESYSGTVVLEILGDFGQISYYSLNNGYMGGENRLKYTDVCSVSNMLSSMRASGYTAAQLKEMGYSSTELKAAGYTASELQEGGYTVAELKTASYTTSEILAAGYTAEDLKAENYTATELKTALYTATEVRTGGYSATQAKAAGFTLSELKTAGYTALELKEAGYTATEMKAEGFTGQELRTGGYTLQQIYGAGYTATELKAEGFTVLQLRTAGYTLTEIKTAGYTVTEIESGGYTATEMKAVGYTATELKAGGYTASELYAAGYSASELKTALYTVSELKEAGYSATQMKVADYSASDLKTAGYTASELKEAGYTATEMKAAGYSALELRVVSYTGGELKTAGFTAAEMKTASYTASELKVVGYTAQELKDGGYSATEMKTAEYTTTELKAVGYTATELKTAGYTAAEMKTALYTATELKAEGYTAQELKDGEYSATEMKTADYNASELKAVGYSASDLKEASFTASDLKAAGFTAAELNVAGFTATELKVALYTASQLKVGGYSASDLKAADYNASELKVAGYNATELKAAEFTATELKTAGYTAIQLKVALYTLAELKVADYSVSDLRTAGYTATEMKAEGYTATELHDGGYSATQLNTAGYTATELKAGGYTLSEIIVGGYSLSEIYQAGYSATELLPYSYTVAELKLAGYSATQMKAAGYSSSQLFSVGYTASQLYVAGYTAAQLYTAGYLIYSVKEAGYALTEIKTSGYSVAQLYSVNYTATEMKVVGYTAGDLKGVYSVSSLRVAGYTATELYNAGYTATEVYNGGYPVSDMRTAGYTIDQLQVAGVTIEEVSDAGYTGTELKSAGYSATELKSIGYTLNELFLLNYTVSELKAAGFSLKPIYDLGFTVAQLREAGYTVTDLKAIGINDALILAGGYTEEEILAAGINFEIERFSSSHTMSELATTFDGINVDEIVAFDATAIFYMSQQDIQKVFTIDLDGSLEDFSNCKVKYFTHMDKWPENFVLNPSNAMLDDGESTGALFYTDERDKMLIKHDFIRYLALKLFGSIQGTDLFNNEDQMITTLNNMGDNSFQNDISGVLWKYSSTNPDPTLETDKYVYDASFDMYATTDELTTNENVGRELFQQLLYQNVSRFKSLTKNADGLFPVPILEGDTITYTYTVLPAPGQNELTGANEFGGRVYKIVIIIDDGLTENTTPTD